MTFRLSAEIRRKSESTEKVQLYIRTPEQNVY